MSDWPYHPSMRVISSSEFKEQCLALLDEVDPEGILVTKRGRPVARLLPCGRGGGAPLGALRGKIRARGDLFGTSLRWKADAEP